MEMVLVLMSTYNGENYLRQQIDSLFAQKDVGIDLVVRDDGSKDNTAKIINELRKSHPNIQLFLGSNKGFVGSFSELVDNACRDTSAKFYAFVDQDDIWYPNKLECAIKKLNSYPNNVPNLFCSNSDIIDSEGNKTGKLFRNYEPNYTRGNVLMYPLIQGCSMVFNRKALELYCAHQPKISYHDRWMYLICHFLGNVFYEPNPLFGYRVHERNALGPRKEYGFYTQCRRLWNMLFTTQVSEYYRMNQEFYDNFFDVLQEKDKKLFEQYLGYKSNFHNKVSILFSKEFGCPIPNVRERLLYIPHVLLNKV